MIFCFMWKKAIRNARNNRTYLQTEMQGCIEALLKLNKEHHLDVVLLPIGYALGDEIFIEELVKLYHCV